MRTWLGRKTLSPSDGLLYLGEQILIEQIFHVPKQMDPLHQLFLICATGDDLLTAQGEVKARRWLVLNAGFDCCLGDSWGYRERGRMDPGCPLGR